MKDKLDKLGGFDRIKSVGGDTMWVMGQDASMVLVSFLSFALIVNAFGPTNYGAYLGAYGTIAPLTGLAWNGVALTMLQRARQDGEDPSKVARNGFSLTFGVGSLVSVVALLLTTIWVPRLSVLEIAFLVCSELLGAAPISLSAALVQSTDGIAAAARIRIIQGVLRAMVLVTLHFSGHLSILTLGASVATVFTLYSIWLITVRLPKAGVHVSLGKPAPDYAATAAQFSVPIMAASIQMDSDKSALNYYGYAEVAGYYGAAFRLVQFAAMPMNSVEAVAFHKFLDTDETAKGQQVRRAAKSSAVTFALAIAAAISLYILAPYLLKIAGSQFGNSVTMVRWLLLWLPFYALSTAPVNALMALKRMKERAILLICSGIVSLVCYITLIPTFTWRGGLIGTVTGEGFTAVVGWLLLMHYQRIHDNKVDSESTQELVETEMSSER